MCSWIGNRITPWGDLRARKVSVTDMGDLRPRKPAADHTEEHARLLRLPAVERTVAQDSRAVRQSDRHTEPGELDREDLRRIVSIEAAGIRKDPYARTADGLRLRPTTAPETPKAER